MIIKENTITEFIQHSTGFTISKSDLTTGKVVVNNIEITSIEDWNKVTKSLIELQQENKELHNKIDKAIEYIEKDTRWFDSEYASMYGELCTCEGARGNRLEVLVNPSNLLEILKDSDVDG